MHKVPLSIASTDYDHFRDFRTGAVQAEGIEHTWSMLGHHEVFARFTFNREWDAAELSFAKFMAQVTRENSDIIGLPVVCSRLFRFSSFYVNKKSGIKSPVDLKGKRVGSPEWAHTAAVYMRGWLGDEHGVKLPDIHWVQAGANEPGRVEKVELNLPKGVAIERIAEKSLSEMLARGEIDCAIIARPPDCFRNDHPDVVRLFPAFWAMEEHYYAETKVWPHHRAAEARARRQPVDRAQPLQRVPGIEAPLGRAPDGPRGVALPAAVAADLRAQDVRPDGRRPVPLRHRRKPPDAGAVLPVYI
jgi:4,5-dihydroxyphthalate decarboxylase